ncbi:SRPBCC domain-containing protein [Streptomyces antimicrobicus]|uniref:SRPBCC family protein n=1 Tax=Streptomyces antimicrobicus TaxID=2883108 RepID=A0ABS8B6P5_9ACTN|nr:SRPBCC domain-containing protein [Streptomyces antimicrobicus]MCB5180290.1 SRPBCC family protein [Streptomyces antimicrobicus]
MEHQVFVPVPVENLRAVLRDPARLARCVPGLQQDADAAAGPLSGRLKLRVGGHTITYRGALSVTERDPEAFEITGEGTEVRGTGAVKVALAVRLAEADGGTRLLLDGTGTADGRAATFEPAATTAALHRLLDRAAGHLASAASAAVAADTSAGADLDTGDAARDATPDSPRAGDVAETRRADDAEDDLGDVPDTRGTDDTEDEIDLDDTEDEIDLDADLEGDLDGDLDTGMDLDADLEAEAASVFDTEVPPSSLDPFADDDFTGFGDAGARPPAEAAHARRTMIGRSAEEVDHAPPRGRYAPVPAPDQGASGGSLRWLVPAAAFAVASAVAVGRVLRRRR